MSDLHISQQSFQRSSCLPASLSGWTKGKEVNSSYSIFFFHFLPMLVVMLTMMTHFVSRKEERFCTHLPPFLLYRVVRFRQSWIGWKEGEREGSKSRLIAERGGKSCDNLASSDISASCSFLPSSLFFL
jgi:hypothetical protein